MGKCSIKCCRNRNDNRLGTTKSAKYFYFPSRTKNKETFDKWLEICHMDESKYKTSAFVCEDHFVQSDYKPKPKYLQNCPGYSYSPKRRRIKDDAIPSKNLQNVEQFNSSNELQAVQLDDVLESVNQDEESVSLIQRESSKEVQDVEVDGTLQVESSQEVQAVQFAEISAQLQESLGPLQVESIDGDILLISPKYLQLKNPQHIDDSQLGHQNLPLRENQKEKLKRKSSEDLEEIIEIQELKNKILKIEDEGNKMKMKYNKLLKKHSDLCNTNEKRGLKTKNSQVRINTLEVQINTLKKDVKNLQKKDALYDKMEAALKSVFTNKQIHKIMNPNLKHVHWDTESISRAISLSSFSGSAYRYMQSINYPLPSRSSIRRWGSVMQVQEGVLQDVIYMMQGKGQELEQHQKLVVLSFDEVYLDHRMDICKRREQVIGPHKTAQVCFARGLFDNWKQPIFYKFDQNLTKEILDEIIKKLYRIGYIVVAVVTDLGGNNPQAFKKYNIGIGSKENCFFIHPCNEKLKIFVFADVPHLFKLFRNHLLDEGYKIHEKLEDGTVITKHVNKKILEELLSIEQDSELKIAFKLKKEQIDVRGSKRMKVSPATKLVSKSTARAMRWYGMENLLDYEDWALSADVFELMDQWFGIFDSKKVYGHSLGQEPYGEEKVIEQDEILAKVTDLMLNIQFGKQEALRPFQKGIILNNNSLPELLIYLQKTYTCENFQPSYILTNRLNQDVLENFFAIIRAMGRNHDHPSALEFEYRLRSYILGKHAAVILSRHKNCEDDNDKNLVDFSGEKKRIATNKILISKDEETCRLINEREEEDDKVDVSNSNKDANLSSSFNEMQETPLDTISEDLNIEAVDDLQDTVNDTNCKQSKISKNDYLKDLVELLGIDEIDDAEESNTGESVIHLDANQETNNELLKKKIHLQALGFAAGYTAYHFRIEYSFLGCITSKETENAQPGLSWLKVISDGWLRIPSKRWYHAAQIIDEALIGFHGKEDLSKEPEIFSKVTDIAFQDIEDKLNQESNKKETITREVVFHQVKTRTYFRLRFLQFLQRKNELLKKIERQKKKEENLAKKQRCQGIGLNEQKHLLAKVNKFLPLPIYPQYD